MSAYRYFDRKQLGCTLAFRSTYVVRADAALANGEKGTCTGHMPDAVRLVSDDFCTVRSEASCAPFQSIVMRYGTVWLQRHAVQTSVICHSCCLVLPGQRFRHVLRHPHRMTQV